MEELINAYSNKIKIKGENRNIFVSQLDHNTLIWRSQNIWLTWQESTILDMEFWGIYNPGKLWCQDLELWVWFWRDDLNRQI